MAGLLDTIKSKIGVPGPKKYSTAPVVPPFSGMNLKEKLQSLVLQRRTGDREQRMRRNTVHYLMALYYQGYQSVQLNDAGSAFDIYERDDFYVENQFRVHVDTIKQILNKMEGDIVIRPASDNPRDIATSRAADTVLQMQRDAIGYESLLDQKNLNKCLFGGAFIFTDYIRDKKYGSIVTPKFSYQSKPGPDGEDMLSKVASGYDTRNKGRQVATVCSPLEINTTHDVRPFDQVPYMQWISRQDIELLNWLYPGLHMDSGMSDVESDLAQQYIAVLGNLPGNILGDSLAYNRGSSQTKKAELVRSWLQPPTFQGDKELEREFPDGVHVTTVNGQVVDYYEENLCDRWVHEVLIPVPHSLFGDGLYDAILMQDQINEINSLLIQHMRYTTVGHKVYNANYIDAKDVVNDPKNGWIPAKPGMDMSISQLVTNLPPGQLSGDVPAWLSSVKQAMMDMTGAHDPVRGQSSGANTPYSQSVFLTERAQSRWQGSASYNHPQLIRFHEILLEDARTNWVDMQQKAAQDNTGQWSFQQFSQADIQGEVDIIITNSDFKPRTRAEQVQGLQMYVQLAPIIPGLPPKQKLRIEEMLGLPPDSNPMSNQISRAYRMIDRMKKHEVISPLPMVDNAAAQGPVFADFLVSEEGEALAESDPEAYANIFTYMMTLLQMQMMQMSSPGGAMASQIMGSGPQQQEPEKQGSPPGESKPPGGQPGQNPGGNPQNPNGAGQAQSPAAAAPMPPMPAGVQGQ